MWIFSAIGVINDEQSKNEKDSNFAAQNKFINAMQTYLVTQFPI